MSPPALSDSYFLVDPFQRHRQLWPSFVHAMLATALFRCWHILLFFAAWSTTVCVVTKYSDHSLAFAPTLLTVLGTVLGFIVSYRTTSSFERYNEGRKLWSQIILYSRTFARIVWIQVPDAAPNDPANPESLEQRKARTLIEKKTVLNLLEAFAVSVKHYLRGEEGIYYKDLYHLVKFIPAYALPPGRPPADSEDLPSRVSRDYYQPKITTVDSSAVQSPSDTKQSSDAMGIRPSPHLPLPASNTGIPADSPKSSANMSQRKGRTTDPAYSTRPQFDQEALLPARLPPKSIFSNIFPFSLLVRLFIKSDDSQAKQAERNRAKMKYRIISHNIPLEISLYLGSYIATLSARKALEAPTSTAIMNALTALVDSLTGLERILTTPIPFSYSFHLWMVTTIYCFFLPCQIYSSLGWLTIPGSTIVAFIFFGFLVAGEEIENPFGYDKNDLNLDYFTHDIIRRELRAITRTAAPDPANWVFSDWNDRVFQDATPLENVTPQEWMTRGLDQIQEALDPL